jgi:hypothetical protein
VGYMLPRAQVSYRSYWTHVVLEVLHENVRGNLSIKDISNVRAPLLSSALPSLAPSGPWRGSDSLTCTCCPCLACMPAAACRALAAQAHA